MGTIAGDELGGWDAAAADEVLGGSGGTIDVGGGSNTPGNGGGAGLDRFLVSVRLRPLNDKEISNRDPSEWDCRSDNTVIFKGTNLHDRSLYPGSYTFDKVFSADCNTRKVYEQGAKEVALSVVNGINSSIFAYGQTSSGKTYTMSGITEYAVADIYDYIEKHSEREFVLKFSAMEIYNEAVRDLLSLDPTALRLLDDPERGTIVEKLTEETLRDRDHLMELLSICQAQRQIGETSLNETSSRSHQILRLTIESSSRKYAGKESASTLAACVNFVDLAGSERASQAMSAGTRLKEGCHINRSLLTLGTVIRKLSKGRNGHIPYRDSKLTRILHPSLGGNARTAIICTMSPARSHMEQSRNTLLFASCAKEVSTNAQVNVVMSDKALVKHLQKELARLENELRRPGSFCPDTLLKEKENQIYKMEKEIKMLVQQRDLAQSQLDGLLQSVKDDQTPRQLFCQFPAFHLSGGSIDMDSMSETSSIAGHDHHYARKISKYQESANFGGIPNVNYPERPHMEDRISPRRSISSPTFVGLLIDGNEDITLDNNEEFEDLCKDVQCIEMDETSAIQSPTEKPDLPSLPGDAGYLKDEGVVLNDENRESRAVIPERDISSVKQKIEVDKKANFLEPYCEEVSSNYGDRGYCSSRRSVLARSRSCRANITYNAPSPWFLEEEQSETTPPSMSFKEYPGRPEGFQRKTMTLNYRAGSGTPSEVSRSSESIASFDPLRSSSAKGDYEENISCVSDFVSGMKEVAQIHHPDDIPGCKELKDEGNGDVAKSTKDMSVDAKVYPSESPTRWPYEFEKQRQRIIDLWHECNVSLVHRTYFFFLFKGDPEDSVYMEVELRRLSFLRNSFSQGGLSKHPLGDGFITSPASSMKALRREREKLCRSMQKRLSAAERDSLFRKWRIPLDSKQRRMQLARLLWSDTTDMEHIRESASVVAKLVGLQESGMAMKEMYGLSFGPEKMTRRTYSWT